MFFYKIVMCIIVFFMTVGLSVLNPPMHKPFVVEDAGFKLTRYTQDPATLETLKVVRLGEAPVQEQKIVTQIQQNPTSVKSQIHIEPSEYYQIANKRAVHKKNTQKQSVNDNSIIAQNQYQENYDNSIEDVLDNETFDIAEPVDNSLKGRFLQKKEETIAWNKWRSDLQNRIMGDASVSAPIGTIFFFSFNVDDRHHISNIKVMCSNPFYQEEAVKTIASVIEGYEGRDFLEFPHKTKRRSVRFDGSYMIWIDTLYSSPENYNDFERVQYYE